MTRHDGREDGFSPIAAAFAIWTGAQRAEVEQVALGPANGGFQDLEDANGSHGGDGAGLARVVVDGWLLTLLLDHPGGPAGVGKAVGAARQGRSPQL